MYLVARIALATGLLALPLAATAANLIPPAALTVSGITVMPTPQVRVSVPQTLSVDKARAKNGWQLTIDVAGDALLHNGSSATIPAQIRFTSVQGLYGASTAGLTIATDGSAITSGPYNGQRSYQAEFQATLNVPALPRAGSYSGTITFIITEY